MSQESLKRLRAGELAGARRLDISAGLTQFPEEIFDLADTLEVLNLSGNRLRDLPADLGRLHRLRILFCSDNGFTHLPLGLGDCPSLEMVGFKANRIARVPAGSLPARLRWLILTDNAIGDLPSALGERPALQKLMLAGNRLQSLPDSLCHASRLELLRLSANALTRLPLWLTRLPRLGWLALAGNPMPWHRPRQAPLPVIRWTTLSLGERLGGGASGDIFRARCKVGTMEGEELALKLFKGAMTSDGLPRDELAASLCAGMHPALTTPVAVVEGHPDGVQGLLMPLVPDGHVNLAAPPSMDSCTRDVYPPGWVILPGPARQLLSAMASALAQLHARGVMHGDFYGHNILWQPATGQAMLGDFGAATLLPQDDPALAGRL
ncbi:MAG: leucine-rich repeat-containing protein kinase family protein, partial [Gammaproteobacteria bacterium]